VRVARTGSRAEREPDRRARDGALRPGAEAGRWQARLRHGGVAVLGLGLFGLALLALRAELRHYTYHDLLKELRSLPRAGLVRSLVLTLGSYTLLTGYDALGLRYLGRPLAYRRIALASFIGYAFSNSAGLPFLSGSAVRLRLYSAWGLSTLEIAQVASFNVLTLVLGLATMSSFALFLSSAAVASTFALPLLAVRAIASLALTLVAVYLILTTLVRKPIRLGRLELPLPTPRTALAQVLLASADWALAGAVLYVLLPAASGLSYPRFLCVFLIAQVAGLASNVPAGLGVFETVMLRLLTGAVPASVLLGAIVAYRAIYYVLPLLLAAVLLAVHEVLERREGVRRVARFFGRWAPGLVPQTFAWIVFLGGALLLLSGATPTVNHRLRWLQPLLPLPVLEISHFLGSVAGMGLVLLARGLQRRLDAAYVLTVALRAACCRC
jgi:phosphatidylglycerol lysyltransferase